MFMTALILIFDVVLVGDILGLVVVYAVLFIRTSFKKFSLGDKS